MACRHQYYTQFQNKYIRNLNNIEMYQYAKIIFNDIQYKNLEKNFFLYRNKMKN